LGAAPDSDDENPPSESQVCRFYFIMCTRISLLLANIPFHPLASSSTSSWCSCLVSPPPLVPRQSCVTTAFGTGTPRQ
jgi:hypothetical protein